MFLVYQLPVSSSQLPGCLFELADSARWRPLPFFSHRVGHVTWADGSAKRQNSSLRNGIKSIVHFFAVFLLQVAQKQQRGRVSMGWVGGRRVGFAGLMDVSSSVVDSLPSGGGHNEPGCLQKIGVFPSADSRQDGSQRGHTFDQMLVRVSFLFYHLHSFSRFPPSNLWGLTDC